MGLISRFTGGDDDDPDAPDHYRVVHMPADQRGDGWQPVNGYDEMDTPITEQTFRYNEEPLDPGSYRLFAVQNNLNQQPPDGEGWSIEIDPEPTTETTDEDSEMRRLERKIDRLQAEGADQDDGEEDIQDVLEQKKAALSLKLMEEPEFIRRHGDKLALSMFDVDSSPSGSDEDTLPDYEQFDENPGKSALYSLLKQAADDPNQFSQIMESVGEGAGSLLGGAASGAIDPGNDPAVVEASQPDQDDDTDDTTDDQPTDDELDEIGGGPSNPDELIGSQPDRPDDDQLAEQVAAAEKAQSEAADADPDAELAQPTNETAPAGDRAADAGQDDGETVVRREEPGTTAADPNDPMTAGPRQESEGDPDPDHASNGHDEEAEIETPADAREELQDAPDDQDSQDDDGGESPKSPADIADQL